MLCYFSLLGKKFNVTFSSPQSFLKIIHGQLNEIKDEVSFSTGEQNKKNNLVLLYSLKFVTYYIEHFFWLGMQHRG